MAISRRSSHGRGGGPTPGASTSRASSTPGTSTSRASLTSVAVREARHEEHEPNIMENEDEQEQEQEQREEEQQEQPGQPMTLEDLLRTPGRELYLPVLNPERVEGTIWFHRGEKKGIMTRKISKILKYKFNKPYYSWRKVPHRRREKWLIDFAHQFTWDPLITTIVRWHFEKVCINRLKGMISVAKRGGTRPSWIVSSVLWTKMCAYWATDYAQSRSRVASNSRNSDRGGIGVHKHVAGPTSFKQIQEEMEIKYGRSVSVGEVFVKTHTRADGTYVDQKAKKIADTYEMNVREKLTGGDDLADPNSLLSTDELDSLFLKSSIPDSRGTLYGLGSMQSHFMKNNVGGSCSYTSMASLQEELQAAHRKIEEQAPVNAQRDAEAATAKQMAQEANSKCEMLLRYLHKDPGFALYVAAQEQTIPSTTPASQ